MSEVATHDWASAISSAESPFGGSSWEHCPLAAFRRPDGSTATVFGCVRCLVFIEGTHAGSSVWNYDAKLPNTKLTGEKVDGVFAKNITSPYCRTTIAHLRSLVGELPATELVSKDCPKCNGTGEVECYSCGHETECEDCDGTGKIKEQEDVVPRVLHIGTDHFDALLLGEMLALLPSEEIGIEIGGADPRLIRLVGVGWQVLASSWTNVPEEHERVEFRESPS